MASSTQRNDIEMAVVEAGSIYSNHALADYSSRRLYLRLKRMIDICLASIGLFLLMPIFLVTALLIKIEDPKGSIFFKQKRIGINEKPFYMYKFRSMVSNAEELLNDLVDSNEISGAMFKLKKDPRITNVGKFIRKTSIDELPQLWNVILGNMSIVGPRPPLPKEVSQYTNYDRLRLKVMPGCTGLWQVSGRNSMSFKEMVELDLYYIRNRNILMDIKIMAKTVKVMILPNNAY